MVVVTLIALAGVFAWKALYAPAESVEAPVPSEEFVQEPGPVVGPTGEEPVEVPADGDGTQMMTPENMGPGRLFIPALGVYMKVEADSTFEQSKYAGFDTLRIPSNPKRGVHFAGGASMYGQDTGTTLVASHVSARTGWGALRYLYRLRGGELIYTTDDQGRRQTWQMTQMRVENHTSFPQEFWSPEGVRQLVVATCGGKVLPSGTFKQNIFAIAVPVDPLPKTPEQLAAEEAVAQASRDAAAASVEASEAAGE